MAGAGLLLLSIATCVGCAFSADRKEAEQLAEQYFATVRAEDLDAVLSLYSPRFFATTPREEWRKFLGEQRSRCGTPQSHALVNWDVLNSIGSNSGVRTTLVYDVQYLSCRMFETITAFKPSGGKMQIQGHFFKPKDRDILERKDSSETMTT